MAANSNIEWCDATFNPWIGCTKVSPGCDHCYAARQDAHRRWTPEGWGGPRKRTKTWGDPVKWNAAHEAFFAEHGRRQRVFCASLADWLDNQVAIEWLVDLLELVRTTPNLDWLLLSKRIGNWRDRLLAVVDCIYSRMLSGFDALVQWVRAWLAGDAPRHVHVGATTVNQPEVDRDVVKLLAVPARVRFLSIEPMLGPIDLQMVAVPRDQDQLRRPWDFEGSKFNALQLHDDDRFHQPPAKLDWVICGGESGPGARPLHPDWARSLRDQCAAAGVPFLFKQWGEFAVAKLSNVDAAREDRFIELDGTDSTDWPIDRHSAGTAHMVRLGKKAAGRLLDGVEHNGFPGA